MALIINDFDAARRFVFKGRQMMVDEAGRAGAPCAPAEARLVCRDTVTDASAATVGPDFEAPEGWHFIEVREYFASQSDEEGALAARCKGLAEWLALTRYCGSCGAALQPHAVEDALVCPQCGRVHYPRISPCVIAVIERGDEMLLLRHKLRNQDIFACLAGFVETGESLEQALRREVREEVGLEIGNIRYAGSQGWPFPDQLMVGFYADYVSGDIKIQESEITEARWFHNDDLPKVPRPGSISSRLIHHEL